jgi:hypothetical protein
MRSSSEGVQLSGCDFVAPDGVRLGMESTHVGDEGAYRIIHLGYLAFLPDRASMQSAISCKYSSRFTVSHDFFSMLIKIWYAISSATSNLDFPVTSTSMRSAIVTSLKRDLSAMGCVANAAVL